MVLSDTSELQSRASVDMVNCELNQYTLEHIGTINPNRQLQPMYLFAPAEHDGHPLQQLT